MSFTNMHDNDLERFEAQGAQSLPAPDKTGYVEHQGCRIWYAVYGSGTPVILLHGGLGHSGNWGYQLPALTSSGYSTILIDSRGHGRSTWNGTAFTYELMAMDVLAVMDILVIEKAAFIGWSDGACTALILATMASARAVGVFFFGCNMDPSGTKELVLPNIVLDRCLARHRQDYTQLSATPDQFDSIASAVSLMQQTQPNYSAADLALVQVPVTVVQAEHDEFIKLDHAQYLARSIPQSEFIYLAQVSHFAPLQRPELFNNSLLTFLEKAFKTAT